MLLCSTEVVLRGTSNRGGRTSGGRWDYGQELGRRTFPSARAEQRSDRITQVPVCEGDYGKSRGNTSHRLLMFPASPLRDCSRPFRGRSPRVSLPLSPSGSLRSSLL